MSFEIGPHRTNLVLCPSPSNHSCIAFSSFDRPCSPSSDHLHIESLDLAVARHPLLCCLQSF